MTDDQSTTDDPAAQAPTRFSNAAPALFFLGLLWLAVMGFVAAWPDMEASTFDAGTSLAADDNLESLSCPWVMATDETATVTTRLVNRAARPESFLLRTRITRGFLTLVREDTQQVTLQPGEIREFSWPVTAEDAAYRRLVMTRVFATRSAFHPAREGYCGILVLGISGVGGQWLFAAGVLLGLAATGLGATWWWWRRRPLNRRNYAKARRHGVLAAFVIGSLITGMIGWWMPSHLLLLAAFLYSILMLERANSV